MQTPIVMVEIQLLDFHGNPVSDWFIEYVVQAPGVCQARECETFCTLALLLEMVVSILPRKNTDLSGSSPYN